MAFPQLNLLETLDRDLANASSIDALQALVSKFRLEHLTLSKKQMELKTSIQNNMAELAELKTLVPKKTPELQKTRNVIYRNKPKAVQTETSISKTTATTAAVAVNIESPPAEVDSNGLRMTILQELIKVDNNELADIELTLEKLEAGIAKIEANICYLETIQQQQNNNSNKNPAAIRHIEHDSFSAVLFQAAPKPSSKPSVSTPASISPLNLSKLRTDNTKDTKINEDMLLESRGQKSATRFQEVLPSLEDEFARIQNEERTAALVDEIILLAMGQEIGKIIHEVTHEAAEAKLAKTATTNGTPPARSPIYRKQNK